MNLTFIWRPHSPRAGFCTFEVMRGVHPAVTAETTRHVNLKSFRGYVDAQSAIVGDMAERVKPWRPLWEYLEVALVPEICAVVRGQKSFSNPLLWP